MSWRNECLEDGQTSWQELVRRWWIPGLHSQDPFQGSPFQSSSFE